MPRGAALAAGTAAAAAGPARAPGSGPGGAGPGGLTLAEQTGALGRMRRVKAIVARDNILKIAEVGCRFASATAARPSPRAEPCGHICAGHCSAFGKARDHEQRKNDADEGRVSLR